MGGKASKVINKNTIDIVYIMDDRSKRENIELMFSLRSVKKHLKNYRKIHIVGEDMSKTIKATRVVKHHVLPPTEGYNHQIKKHHMIDLVCQNDLISDEFVLISDDCFLLQNHDVNKLPFYYSGTLEERVEGYRNQNSASIRNLRETGKLLKDHNRQTKYYNTHTPLLINKKDFLALKETFYIEEFECGLLYKTLYCNFYKKRGKFTPMNLIYYRVTREILEAKIKKGKYFAVNDSGLTLPVIKFLNDTFPTPLLWER
jgi:hypothetical protein